jgi:hypothetical protein
VTDILLVLIFGVDVGDDAVLLPVEISEYLALLCIAVEVGAQPPVAGVAGVISSASSMEGGEVFYGPTDWLGSCNPMTHYDYTPDSSFGTG